MILDPKFPAVLDSTILKAWKSCPRKTFYEHFCGLRERDDSMSVDLVAGRAMASGLEAARKAFYFSGMTTANAIDEGQIALGMAYGSDRAGEKKSLSRVRSSFQHYFDVWPLDRTVGVVPIEGGVEKSFSVPISEELFHPDTGLPLQYAGRIDMLGTLQADSSLFGYDELESALYGVDEKTTGSINSSFYSRYDIDFQMLGYVWAYGKVGINLAGIKVRGIGLTNKKEIDVITDYKETTVLPSPLVIEDWYVNLKETAEEMVQVYKNMKGEGSYKQNFGNSCNDYGRSCSFKPVCSYSPSVPEYQIVRWNPLEKS